MASATDSSSGDQKPHAFKIGYRVELHPACDMWMRGARFGEVRGFDRERGLVMVRLDLAPRKLRGFTPDLLRSAGRTWERGAEYGAMTIPEKGDDRSRGKRRR